MIVIGVDPGTASTGFGVISRNKEKFECLEYGVIRTTPNFSTPERLKKLYNELNELIKKHKPDILVVESLYFFKNLKTAMPVSQAKGVILLTAAKKRVPVYELTPPQIKLAVTGSGRTEKKPMQKKVKSLLKLKELPQPDDAADALAAALAFCLKRDLS